MTESDFSGRHAMTIYRTRSRVVLCIAIIYACITYAQPMERKPEIRVREDNVSFESFFRAVGNDSVTVDILYRFRHDFFIFIRKSDSPLFCARGEVLIEILDSTENSVARHIQSFDITADDMTPGVANVQYWQGVATFHLPRRHHIALCVLTDMEAQQKQVRVRLDLAAPVSHITGSSLLLAQSVDTTSGLIPCNLAGNAFFGSDLFAVAALKSDYNVSTVTYGLTRVVDGGEDRLPFQRDTSVTPIILRNTKLVPGLDSLHMVVYNFVPDMFQSVAVLPLHGIQLPQGRYELRLWFDARDTSSLRSSFGMRWVDMPLSLRDLDGATEAMKYITTEDEYDQLTSGRRASRIHAFDAFWKKQDPTLATAYNERLAEYFRRVDYAYANFRTLKENNGVATDMGRIYILYGAPTARERILSPDNAPCEVWRYTSRKKIFTFEDATRQGNYLLIHTDTQ